ncbi:MAG: formate dehydrogenase subunit alpha [Myxococcales bacterium]|nr:formate dehydrogenase subunit alpha [Myxococcales bacterium]
MVQITVNGRTAELEEGLSILDALRRLGLEVPHLCHDDRVQAAAVCRTCLVEVEGEPKPVPSCATRLREGMVVRTDTPALEDERRGVLRMLAWRYPAEPAHRFPEKPFHKAVSGYGLSSELRGMHDLRLQDSSHPHIQVDMSRCIDCYLCVRICDELQGQFVWRVLGRGAETRVTPGTGVSLLASACVGCGACASTCPTGALEDKTRLEQGSPERWTRTTCPYCGVGCELEVGSRGERVVAVRPVLDAPVNKGHLCVKGRYAFEFVHADDRVTTPMIRDRLGWRRVSWPEATGFVAERLRGLVAQYGPDSVGVLGSSRATNEENYLAQKFARVVLGTNNVDCCARVCHAPTAAALKLMLGTGAATNSFNDIERARTLMVCGSNTTENHPVVGARIKQAALRGANLVVIDPRRIELADYAVLHLQHRLGTDVALFNAMAHTLVAEELVDREFIDSRVAEWEEFQRFIVDWTPERASALCGVSADSIRRAARLFGTAKPSLCVNGLGLTEHSQGTENVMCLVNLALLTGNVGRPGTGVNPMRGQNNVQGAAQMGCEPSNLTGFVPVAQGREAFERAWGAALPARKGLDVIQMVEAAKEGRLKGLWAIGYDLLLTNPGVERTRDALRKLGLLIVQDLFMNETAREVGTVFLPACSSFEKDGTFMNAERRIQRVRKVLEPLAGSKPDWEIICAVARALGHAQGFEQASPEEIWSEVRTVWKVGAGIGYSRLEQGGLQWPCPSEDHPGTEILHRSSFPVGPRAALRRIDFKPSAEARSAELPYLLNTGRSLYQFNAGTMTLRTPNRELRPADTLDLSPDDARALQLSEGDRVRVRSRYGEATLPAHVSERLRPGECFATFHTPTARVNALTSDERDPYTHTPEYKVTAVALEKC